MEEFLSKQKDGRVGSAHQSNSKASFKTGTKVRHGTLGIGVVKGTEGSGDMEKVTVQFQTGIKKLMARFAGLEIL